MKEERNPYSGRSSFINMAPWDRVVSIAAGAGLLGLGARRLTPGRFFGAATGAGLIARGLTGHCPGYTALGVRSQMPSRRPRQAGATVTILKPSRTVEALFRSEANVRRLIPGLDSLERSGENTWKWSLSARNASTLHGEVRIHRDENEKLIHFEPTERSQLALEAVLGFRPLDTPGQKGTIVRFTIRETDSDSALANFVGSVFMRAGPVLNELAFTSLRRAKQLLETGEIATIEGQPSGRRGLPIETGNHPGLPVIHEGKTIAGSTERKSS